MGPKGDEIVLRVFEKWRSRALFSRYFSSNKELLKKRRSYKKNWDPFMWDKKDIGRRRNRSRKGRRRKRSGWYISSSHHCGGLHGLLSFSLWPCAKKAEEKGERSLTRKKRERIDATGRKNFHFLCGVKLPGLGELRVVVVLSLSVIWWNSLQNNFRKLWNSVNFCCI